MKNSVRERLILMQGSFSFTEGLQLVESYDIGLNSLCSLSKKTMCAILFASGSTNDSLHRAIFTEELILHKRIVVLISPYVWIDCQSFDRVQIWREIDLYKYCCSIIYWKKIEKKMKMDSWRTKVALSNNYYEKHPIEIVTLFTINDQEQ